MICIPEAFEILRASEWPRKRDQHLKLFPYCVVCGQRAETVHHVVPVGVDPSRELDESNYASVCHYCHFVVGHACNWQKYVPNFWQVARTIQFVKIGSGIINAP